MKRSLFLNSLAAAALLVPALVFAQAQDAQPNRPTPPRPGDGQMRRAGPGGGPMGQGMGQAMMQRRQAARAELGLTDVQKADIRKARENTRRDRLRKSTDLKIANMDLRSLLRAEKVDEKAVAVKLAEVQAAQGALLKLRVDSVLAMKRILTPEQQKKLTEFRGNQGRGRMGQRMKMRGMNGRGAMRQRMMPGMRDDDSDLDLDLDPDDEDGPAEVSHGDIR